MLDRRLASLGDGLVALDTQWRYTYANDAALRMLGLTRDEVIGRHIEDVLPSDVLAQVLPRLRDAVATGQPTTYEACLPAVGRWFEHRCSPSADGATVLYIDVTARRRASEALRRREEMQAMLVDLLERTRHLRDPEEVMWACVRGVGEHLHVTRCMFGEVDPTLQTVLVGRDYLDDAVSVSGRHRLEDFGVPLAEMLRAGRTFVMHDAHTDPRTADRGSQAAFGRIGARAVVVVPLLKDGRLVALLSVHQADARRWHGEEVTLLERLAEQIWFAVANARAEAALRESRDVLALAMRGGRMGAWSRNLETNEVWWSSELEEIFGLAPGTFAGSEAGFLARVHDDDRARVESAVDMALRTRTDYLVEFRFIHADGSWRWMDGRGRGVYAEDGRPLWLYGIGIDITERKGQEAALERARARADADAERLHLAMVAARLGDWQWDARTDAMTFSPRGAAIFGVAQEARCVWAQLCAQMPPEDVAWASTAMAQALAAGDDYAAEFRLRVEDRERWVSVRGRPRLDAAGRPVGMIGIVQDLSHDRVLVRLDDALRSLSAAADIKATAARVLGEHLQVERCTYATFRDGGDRYHVTCDYASGLPSMVGEYSLSYFHPDLRAILASGQAYVVNDCATDPRLPGEVRRAYAALGIGALISAPIVKAGRLEAAMSVHTKRARPWERQDVELVQQVASRCWESIERARVEEDRAALLARERVARQQAEMQNHRLAQLSEAAATASRAKDEFMAMLGHELRNPLAPILTALQLMRLRGDVGSERERVVIERQVRHLTRLVDDLLDVSRIARGKVELKPAPVETAEVVARAIEMASPLFEQRAQTLHVDVPRGGLPMLVDAERLSQVVANLLTNAAKYTAAGGRIEVTAARDAEQVVVQVTDTGIGMAPELVPRVFDLFVQDRQALDRAEGGLGLGLTIVRSLVERHGGTVHAFSEGPGRGSTFTIRVPRAATLTLRDVSRDADATQTVAASARGATRVLIVDDNEDAAEMLAHVLSARGHVTRVAHDGVEALQACVDFQPQAAFLDLGLPVMDGYELASRLRELPGLEQLRLIAVTGYGQDSDRRRTRAAGFHHHLVKPVDVTAIEALLA